MKDAKIIKLPIESLRKIQVPHGESEKTIFFAIVRVSDLPFELLEWDELSKDRVLPDENHVKSSILNTIENAPHMFQFMHRGIRLSARNVDVKGHFRDPAKKPSKMYLEFSNEKLDGILDGRYTLSILRGIESDATILVEVVEGLEDENLIADIRRGY